MPKITKRFVESVTPHTTKQLIFWDSDLKGFGLVVLPGGRRTYCIQYRNQDRVLKRFKIGMPMVTFQQKRLVPLPKNSLGAFHMGQTLFFIKKKTESFS